MRAFLVAVLALFTTVPLAVAVGPGAQAAGDGTYTYTATDLQCSSWGHFTFVENAFGAVHFAGATGPECFPFFPDGYGPDECARGTDGSYACAYVDGGYSSSLNVAADGAFEYLFVFADGSTDAVAGRLRFL